MAVARGFSFPETFAAGLDELLLGVCEELQLTSARYDLAVERYNTLNKVLEGKESPFRYFRPEIYPQGSMALGTTVKPINGPHDLAFVLQLSRDHQGVDPNAVNSIVRILTTERCLSPDGLVEKPLRQIEERRSEALAADQSFSTSHTTTRSKIFFSHTFPA
jgi:hypothetical protein